MKQCHGSAGVGRMTWLIDFAGYSLSNAPPVRMSMQTTSILQNHYPERLGLAVCYHPPMIFQVTWKVITLQSALSKSLAQGTTCNVINLLGAKEGTAGAWPV